VERKPVEPRRIAVPELKVDEDEDRRDELRVAMGLAFTDPAAQRAFELRLASRRAAGGERAASLALAEQRHREYLIKERERQERAARRRANKAKRQGG
jgi:hypothetical protein